MTVRLSNLPRPGARRELPSSLAHNISNHSANAMASDLVVLRSPSQNLWELKPGADISRANAKCLRIFRNNEPLLASLNNWLGGGNSYPFLNAFLNISIGLVPVVGAGCGIAWTVFFAGLDSASARVSTQCFARVADQLWMVEAVGLDDGDPTFMQQIWLFDPLRNSSSGSSASSWCLAEQRCDVVI